MHYRAVDGVSRDILIVDKECKIIAHGTSVAMNGDSFVSIRLNNDDIVKHFVEMTDMTKSLMHSVGHVRFRPVSGMYISPALDLGEKDNEIINNIFDGTYAVSEFELRYRMVPEFFKYVEGYGAGLSNKE